MAHKEYIDEKKIDTIFSKVIHEAGGMCIKLFMGEGLPDRLVLLPDGVIAFAEMKRPTGKTSKLQDVMINKIRQLGFNVYVIKNESDIKKVSGELCSAHT